MPSYFLKVRQFQNVILVSQIFQTTEKIWQISALTSKKWSNQRKIEALYYTKIAHNWYSYLSIFFSCVLENLWQQNCILKLPDLYKVHIFWEGHKILRNLPLTFDCMYCSQKLGEDFAKFCGLLKIYELFLPEATAPKNRLKRTPPFLLLWISFCVAHCCAYG